MKYCPRCGAKLSDSSKFCNKCGYQVKQPVTPTKNYVNSGTNTDVERKDLATKAPNLAHKMVAQNNTNSTRVDDSTTTSSEGIVNHKNRIIIGSIVGLFIIFLIFTQTASFRNMTTSDSQKTDQLVKWANKNDISIGADISIDGKSITLEPREDSNLEEYFNYSYSWGDDSSIDAEIKDQMTSISEHVEKQWGSGFTEELTNPENSSRTLVTAKDGEITYNYFE